MSLKINNIINKKNKSKIFCLTAYSKNISSIIDKYCDIVLVGDSFGSVLYNYDSTRSVTINQIIEHSKSVKMGIHKSLMVVDMPYNTYRNSKEALINAKLIIKKTKCDAVKLEGGKKILNIVKHLRKNKINIMGHIGLTPQTHTGKFSYKGKKINDRKNIIKDAELLQKAGVFSIVIECVENKLAKFITSILKIPTIGIGASKYCDGQILVTDDLIGLTNFQGRFVKKYSNMRKIINNTVSRFKHDVIKGKFPGKKNIYG
tara:strand:- start:29 stop:808 length:780 start_codon:yes stop_codon:yes gene_type:complete